MIELEREGVKYLVLMVTSIYRLHLGALACILMNTSSLKGGAPEGVSPHTYVPHSSTHKETSEIVMKEIYISHRTEYRCPPLYR